MVAGGQRLQIIRAEVRSARASTARSSLSASASRPCSASRSASRWRDFRVPPAAGPSTRVWVAMRLRHPCSASASGSFPASRRRSARELRWDKVSALSGPSTWMCRVVRLRRRSSASACLPSRLRSLMTVLRPVDTVVPSERRQSPAGGYVNVEKAFQVSPHLLPRTLLNRSLNCPENPSLNEGFLR